MLGKTVLIAGFAAAVAASTIPASAQGLCDGPVGSGLCGAGIGGGIGAALGGKKGAGTGAIIGGVIGLGSGMAQQQRQPYYRQPAYAPPPPPRTYRRTYQPTYQPTYRPAYSSQLVFSIQSGLLQLGYNPGPADGIYGSGTAGAIEAYQGDNGLLIDGRPSEELYAHMQQFIE